MDTAKPVCAGSNRSLPSMPEVGCLRRVEVVPRHLGQTKVDVGAVDALRILLDIETATLRATRADAKGPSERSVQIPGALNTAPGRCSSRSGPLSGNSSNIVACYRRPALGA